MTTIQRWLAAGLLLCVLALAGAAWHDHRLSQEFTRGAESGVAAERARSDEALRLVNLADAKTTEASRVRYQVTLQSLKDTHDRTVSGLSKALVDSDHHRQRLAADVARLLDEAAGLRADIAAASGPPGGAPGAAEAPVEDLTVADLITSVNENYAICQRNAARLGEIQVWYRGLPARLGE